MTEQSRAVLKSYFVRGNKPTQSQYEDLIDSFALVAASGGGSTLTSAQVVLNSGGTMTGLLILSGNPTVANGAATKTYVDNAVTTATATKMTTSVYDAAGIAQQVVGVSATQTLFNKTFSSPVLTSAALTNPVITLSTTNTITNNDAGATGCAIDFYHNSTSPANSDLQQLTWSFNSSTSVKRTFGLIRNVIDDPTNTVEDARFDFQTIVAGALATRMKIAQGVVVGFPTGDDLGVGTLNATAVYDDGVLLTCYPIEKYVTGTIDINYWDNKAGGEHKPARGFVQKLQTTNLLDLDTYIADWKQKKSLSAFYGFENEKKPTGAAIQRLMETVDLFAIHIDQLNQRLKILEGN